MKKEKFDMIHFYGKEFLRNLRENINDDFTSSQLFNSAAFLDEAINCLKILQDKKPLS